MARLNETSAPATAPSARASNGDDQQLTAETFEAGEQQLHTTMRTKSRRDPQRPPANYEEVKRSLMRQNRNLARSHSAQSLQIRTLGTQISSLLATNTALREENIRLRKEMSTTQSHTFNSGIENLKDALTTQLRSMAALIDTLDAHSVRTLSPQKSPETRKSICLESMQFRDRPSLREIMNETQMAVIMEIPSLEEEAPRLSNSSAGSPDLGPPPVARLGCETSCELPQPAMNSTQANNPEKPMNDSINIEARRKRKDSVGSSHARRRSTLVAPLPDLDKTPSSLKTGAKRKISDRDREDAVLDEGEAFQFSRKSDLLEAKPKKQSTAEGDVSVSTVKRPSRGVLAEKSTNFSPKKARVEDKENAGKPESKPTRDGRRSSRQSRVAIPVLQEAKVLPTKEIELPTTAVPETDSFPKTPAALQILSPTSSEPASRGVGKADTPPPGDLSISSSTVSAEGTRPSRRARAAVNYTEPSLVAKMRRPGKEMLDALSGLQDPRNVMSTSRRVSQDAVAKSLFKETINTDSKAQNTRSPMIRKPEDDPVEELELELSPVDARAPSLSLATLMAASKSTADIKARVPEHELDIFEFKDTTPPDSPEQQVEIAPKGRRHSSKTSERATDIIPARSTKGVVRRKSMMV